MSRITVNSSQGKNTNEKIEDFITGNSNTLENQGFGPSVKNLSKIQSLDNFDIKGAEESYRDMYQFIVKHSKSLIS